MPKAGINPSLRPSKSGVRVYSTHLLLSTAAQAGALKFDFGSGKALPGVTQVAAGASYDPARGFGFLSGAATPAVFAVDVEEGNYDVTMRFGDAKSATSTTIKAESRRLMLEKVETAPGQFETRTFTVNVRKPAMSTGGTRMLALSIPPRRMQWKRWTSPPAQRAVR